MKTEKYVHEGETKENLWLEEGDEFLCVDNEPRKKLFGKYNNYSIQVEYKGVNTFIRLTAGQYTRLSNMKDVKGKKLVATSYTNKWGTHIGLEEKKE